MRPNEHKRYDPPAFQQGRRSVFQKLALFMAALTIVAATKGERLPKGPMLNLDFQQIEDGLIPSKTLYPLYVPLGELSTETVNNRTLLVFNQGQGLDIPHSSLLDPDGSEWVAIVRVFALTDGLVMSQSDGERGYAVYIKDGAVHAAIQTGHSILLLKESPEMGITPCLNNWVTIELKINADMALLILNRAHVAYAPLPAALSGTNCRIRLGEHEALPAPFSRSTTAVPTGFTGAVSSFKLIRQ